jgi:hypothetical protein
LHVVLLLCRILVFSRLSTASFFFALRWRS